MMVARHETHVEFLVFSRHRPGIEARRMGADASDLHGIDLVYPLQVDVIAHVSDDVHLRVLSHPEQDSPRTMGRLGVARRSIDPVGHRSWPGYLELACRGIRVD